jgi:hypothetical protein
MIYVCSNIEPRPANGPTNKSISNSWQKALGILEKLAKGAKMHLQQFGKHIWQIDTLGKFMSRARCYPPRGLAWQRAIPLLLSLSHAASETSGPSSFMSPSLFLPDRRRLKDRCETSALAGDIDQKVCPAAQETFHWCTGNFPLVNKKLSTGIQETFY